MTDADYPAVPSKTGYTGAWAKYTSPIHQNTTIQATYTQLTYTVSFIADSETVAIMTVPYGYVLTDADYPAIPEKEGMTGEWVKCNSPICQDITVQAVYTLIEYTVTFEIDGETVKSMTVPYGYVLTDEDYPDIPEVPDCVGFWEEYTDPIQSDITVLGGYRAAYHTVTFIANTSLSKFSVNVVLWSTWETTITVADGYILRNSDYPVMPEKEGYGFCWYKYNNPITEDITIHGRYEMLIVVDPPRPPIQPPVDLASLSDSDTQDVVQSIAAKKLVSTVVETHSYVYNGSQLTQETISLPR